MTCRLLWSSDALDDLDSIWKDVLTASGDSETADRYIAGLRKEIILKKEYPHSGTPLEFMGMFTGIRFVHYKRYLVFYRIRKDAIEIGRVLF